MPVSRENDESGYFIPFPGKSDATQDMVFPSLSAGKWKSRSNSKMISKVPNRTLIRPRHYPPEATTPGAELAHKFNLDGVSYAVKSYREAMD